MVERSEPFLLATPLARFAGTPEPEEGLVSPGIAVDRQRLSDFCRCWQIAEFALFGSALRNDFRPDSHVDVLLSLAAAAETTLFDLVAMQEEMATTFGPRVHIVSRRAIERSRNPLRRQAILSSAQVLDVA